LTFQLSGRRSMGKYSISHASAVQVMVDGIAALRRQGSTFAMNQLQEALKRHHAFANESTKYIERLAEQKLAAEAVVATQADIIQRLTRGECGTCSEPAPKESGLDIDKAFAMMMRTDRDGLPPEDQQFISTVCAFLSQASVHPRQEEREKNLHAVAKAVGAYAEHKHEQLRKAYVAHGLGGEVGEVIDLVNKHVYHGKPLDVGKVAEELGDVFWGWCRAVKQFGLTPSDVVMGTERKLRARYPNGFNEKDANAKRG